MAAIAIRARTQFLVLDAGPFSAFVGGIDFNGDTGLHNDLLPGTTVNAFNGSMGRADLERLVGVFNQTYAGTRTRRARLFYVTLPPNFSFG